MNRVANLNGGMPLRTIDLELIQNAYADGFKAIIKGLLFGEYTILSGLTPVVIDDNLTVSAGFIFIDELDEIFYVPAKTFTYAPPKKVYLVENFVDDSLRQFKDGVTRNCHHLREYEMFYENEGYSGIALSEFQRLIDSVNARALGHVVSTMQRYYNQQILAYSGTFSEPGDGTQPLQVAMNSFGDVIISGGFSALNEINGLLAVLDTGYCPPRDIIGYYLNSNYSLSTMIIKENGDIVITGADEGTNFVDFKFNRLFSDQSTLVIPVNQYDPPLAPIIIEGGQFPQV